MGGYTGEDGYPTGHPSLACFHPQCSCQDASTSRRHQTLRASAPQSSQEQWVTSNVTWLQLSSLPVEAQVRNAHALVLWSPAKTIAAVPGTWYCGTSLQLGTVVLSTVVLLCGWVLWYSVLWCFSVARYCASPPGMTCIWTVLRLPPCSGFQPYLEPAFSCVCWLAALLGFHSCSREGLEHCCTLCSNSGPGDSGELCGQAGLLVPGAKGSLPRRRI